MAAGAALLLTIFTFATAEPAGCAFTDGQSYCAVANGGLAHEPFNRRPLLPALVRLTSPGDIVSGFQFWTLVALAVTVAGTATLTVALAVALKSRHTAAAGVIAASLVVVMPHGLRLAVVYPVFTDIAAMALGVLWLVVLRSRWALLAPMLALLAVLCRESWVLSVLLVAGWMLLRGPGVRDGLLHIAAAVLGALLDVTRPETGRAYTTTLRESAAHFVQLDGWWSLLVVIGVLAALYVTSRSRTAAVDWLETPLVLVAGSQICLGMVGGSDVSRLLAGALPFLICLAVAWSSRTSRGMIGLAVATASLLVLWRVWEMPLPDQYRQFYRPYAIPSAWPRVAVDMVVSTATIGFLVARRESLRAGRSTGAR